MESQSKFSSDIESLISSNPIASKLKLVDEVTVFANRVESDFSITGRVSSQFEKDVSSISGSIFTKLLESYSPEEAQERFQQIFQVQSGICLGDKFGSIESTDLQGTKKTISHQPNTVLLVDVWATWCGYCHAPMQENVDLLNKHKELTSKGISIVGLSCDKEVQKWKSFVAQKKWNSIPQYNNKDAMNIVGVNGIPHIFIVNKEGIIVYQGHPMSINLHKTLVNLSEGKEVVKTQGGADEDEEGEGEDFNPFWNDIDSETKKVLVSECNAFIKSKGLNNVQLIVNSKKTKNLGNGKASSSNSPMMIGTILKGQESKIEEVLIGLQTQFNFNAVQPRIRYQN